MGVVWKALDTTLDREVALKILPDQFSADPERLARFDREAKLLASLDHRNIASIYGHHEADGVRLAPGETVSWTLDPGTRFRLQPLVGTSKGVTLEGAQFPLLGETLTPGGFAAISNTVDVSPLLISIGQGSVLAAVDREPGPPFLEDLFPGDSHKGDPDR